MSSRWAYQADFRTFFLRLLEYYKGVMILTTNRTDTIDVAFESRIDITLRYPDLSQENRGLIWRNFLESVKSLPTSIEEKDVATLASYPLNGRQIKSAVKTAHIIAASEKKSMSLEHLKLVLDLRKDAKTLLSSKEPSCDRGTRDH